MATKQKPEVSYDFPTIEQLRTAEFETKRREQKPAHIFREHIEGDPSNIIEERMPTAKPENEPRVVRPTMTALIALFTLCVNTAGQSVIRTVANTNELKALSVTTLAPYRFLPGVGVMSPAVNATPENGTNTFRSTYDTAYLWSLDGSFGAGTASIADASLTTNKVDAAFHTVLQWQPTIVTNNIDTAFYNLLVRTNTWSEIVAIGGVPAGFADGVDDTGSSSVTGAASAEFTSSLRTMTGSSGALARTAHGFVTGDGGGALWQWKSSGTTNRSLIYGGTSGHYWQLLPDNGWVPAAALGAVSGANNASVYADIITLSTANNWSIAWPAGTFNIESMITSANLTNLTWKGVSMDKTTIYWTSTGSSDEAWRWTGTGGKIRIANMAFKSNVAGSHRLFLVNGSYTDVFLDNCEFQAPDKIWVMWDAASSINRSTWYKCKFHGTTVSGGAAWTTGISSLTHSDNRFVDCWFENISGSPFELYYTKNLRILNTVITNYGNLDSQQPHGIYVSDGNEDYVIDGCRISDNNHATPANGISYIQIYDHSPPRMSNVRGRITNNYLGWGSGTTKADCVYVYGQSGLILANNIMTNIYLIAVAGGDSTEDIHVTDNIIYGYGGGQRGVQMPSSNTGSRVSRRHLIARNRIYGFTRESIGFGGNYSTVSDNWIYKDTDAAASGLFAIMASNYGTAYMSDQSIQGNYIVDATTAPTYNWGGIHSGKSSTVATYNLIQGNTLVAIRGEPIKATDATIKVYENTRLRAIGANNVSSATTRNND